MLTEDQEAALKKIEDFRNSDATSFLLEGGAGVGKTWLLGQILQKLLAPDTINGYAASAFFPSPALSPTVCVAAPTHKAINVLRRKLTAFGVEWCVGYDDYSYNGTDVITGTTANLLGIRPVITEEQNQEVKFAKTNKGILSKIKPGIVIVDEVSMLGKIDFLDLRDALKRAGSKLIAVGDAGQLPPVKQECIPFEAFKHRATLRQIVRQAEDSAIVTLAWAVRDGHDYSRIEGKGVTRTEYLAESFIEQLEDGSCKDAAEAWRAEEDRPVFIAYTNRRVNEIQDAACMKMYGHGRLAFASGELVLSETNYYRNKVMLCANQDELIVHAFMPEESDPVCGVPVVLYHHSDPRKGKFTAHYLAPEEVKDKAHPYNLELDKRRALAEGLQAEMKRIGRGSLSYDDVNTRRKRAWAAFFDWRDQTVISFRHPFSITSHKSQGSTYKRVFADASDLARYSIHALYVAVTRPREELILAKVG